MKVLNTAELQEGNQDDGGGGSGAPLPQQTHNSEQFSQKTNWKLADLLYNQSCPEDLHVTREKASGPVSVPLGGICKEQKVQREWINPQFGHFHASSRVLYEQSSPLACWEICQDRQNNGNHPIKTADRQTNEKNESKIMRSMG